MNKIFENWNRFVNEIEARSDLGSGRIDVDWAAGKADEVTDEKKSFGDMMVKVAPRWQQSFNSFNKTRV